MNIHTVKSLREALQQLEAGGMEDLVVVVKDTTLHIARGISVEDPVYEVQSREDGRVRETVMFEPECQPSHDPTDDFFGAIYLSNNPN